MKRNGGNGLSAEEVNPAHIVNVTDFSANTLRNIIAHIEVSTEFEHLVYREAELDAVWSITGFVLVNERDSGRREAVRRLHAGVHTAHDLVAASRTVDAAALLRSLL